MLSALTDGLGNFSMAVGIYIVCLCWNSCAQRWDCCLLSFQTYYPSLSGIVRKQLTGFVPHHSPLATKVFTWTHRQLKWRHFNSGARNFGLAITDLTYYKASSQLNIWYQEFWRSCLAYVSIMWGWKKECSNTQLLCQGIFPGMLWALFSLYPSPVWENASNLSLLPSTGDICSQ